jgi:NAD(P)-dependent dehydrogenase (short-subunit alcohol dehydrogenase family)
MDVTGKNILSSLPKGYNAVVVGASGGIGRAICDLLLTQTDLGHLTELSRSSDAFDLLDETSISEHARTLSKQPIHLLICTTGILTTDGRPPEKSLRHIEPEIMLAQFRANAIGPALVAKHFLPLLDRKSRSIAAFLSARVGSIGDNRLGGWISYRSAKAGLNQIVRTASIEVARTHPDAIVTAIQPGTVRTGLSAPYSSGHPTVSADEAARAILSSLNGLITSGSFIAYDGTAIPW